MYHNAFLDTFCNMSVSLEIPRKKLVESYDSFKLLLDATIEAIVIFDENQRCIHANEMAMELTGYKYNELIGMQSLALIDERDHELILKRLEHDKFEAYETKLIAKNGAVLPVLIRKKKMLFLGRSIEISAIINISDIKEANEKIEYMAFYDFLTDLPNRKLMRERLSQTLKYLRRSNKFGALLFLDLDHFKKVNDSFGHENGDILLIEIAQRLNACIKKEDTVARFGGDEFVVLLSELNVDAVASAHEVDKAAQKIREIILKEIVISAPFEIIHNISCSIGIALFNANDDVDTIFQHADLAMYTAKKSGRNAIRFYNESMQKVVDEQIRIEKEIALAFKDDQLELYYQPQVNSDYDVIGFEALCRWNHPMYGLYLPDTFISICEQSGQIIELGSILIKKACEQLQAWSHDALYSQHFISVNVSVKQFEHQDFITNIKAVVQEYHFEKGRLKFELTESILLERFDEVVATMHALEELGISISLDDFGTGFSSLSYLKNLPVQQLKIDKSFVHDILEDENDKAIVKATIAIADSLGISVIAEGVETEEHVTLLSSMGCCHFQGYHFDGPLKLKEINRLHYKSC